VKLKLPDSIHSPEQVEAAIFALNNYIGLRRNETSKTKGSNTSAKPAEVSSPQLEELLGGQESAAALPLSDLEALSAELATWRRARVISLTLPARPPASLKKELVRWFRDQISSDLLVRFSVNSDIAGGMVVRTSSRIRDWSFRRQLFDSRAAISRILREVGGA
jgi:hypothetical protein